MRPTGLLWPLALVGCALLFVSFRQAPAPAEKSSAESWVERDQTRISTVDCGRGETLTRALERPATSLQISFRGTCNEDLLIERGRVTLTGLDASAVIEGSVTVSGAGNVVLESFSVRNSAGNCIVALRSSSAELRNISVAQCGANGIIAAGSSLIFLRGTVSAAACAGAGLAATNSSNTTLAAGAAVTLTGNGIGWLIQVSGSSTMNRTATLQAAANLGPGIVLASGGNLSLNGINTLNLTGNGGPGAVLTDSATLVAVQDSGVTVNLSGNGGAGLQAERTSVVDLLGNSTISSDNAGPGLDIDDGTLRLGDLTATDNGGSDVSLAFGSRATFAGGSYNVGTVTCEPTVLVRGALGCT
ncbi:MAG TPA: hypothetical protein VF017_14455 [Thermoanaerobaculia bacterium]|nr:hypothetical protein [Thermoanaerobaculia bacterium]